jgi:hypothetical protein
MATTETPTQWWAKRPHPFEAQAEWTGFCAKCHGAKDPETGRHFLPWSKWCWTCNEPHKVDETTGLVDVCDPNRKEQPAWLSPI